MKFNRAGAITLSTAALSAGIFFAAPAASASPSTPTADTHATAVAPAYVPVACELIQHIPVIGNMVCS